VVGADVFVDDAGADVAVGTQTLPNDIKAPYVPATVAVLTTGDLWPRHAFGTS